MKKISLVVLVIVSFSLLLVGCSDQRDDFVNSDEVGVMSEPPAQVVSFLEHMDNWVINYPGKTINAKEFLVEIYSTWPEADLGIANYFMSRGYIDPNHFVQLEYHYFKKGKCEMQDSTGKFVPVKITGNNGFVVRVIQGDHFEDLWISLACSNGMMNIQRESDVHISARMEFTIQKGKGLSYYLHDDMWSIRVAEMFGLYLYKGRGYNNKISVEQARALVPTTDTIQITVKVHPGWRFRLDGANMQIYLPKEGWMTPEEFQRRHG